VEEYHKNSEGIWTSSLERGNFPEKLDSNSKEAKALDRLSNPTFREHIMAIGSCLENFVYVVAG